ncbi:MAG: GntR family transcriptional regulator [Pseudomonadota bacterium]
MEIRTADRIREKLEHMIVSGEFLDGERLDEVKLAERFSVSRTPLREAFQGLAASGLLELIPRRGAFIRYPNLVELVEMFEVMAELEVMCGVRAARRITNSQLADIRKTIVNCEKALKSGDSDEYYRENELFHHLIYRASGNSFMTQQASALHKRLKPFRRMQLRVRGRMPQSMQEHHDIVSAIEAGDIEKTAEILRKHVAIQGEKFNDLMANYSAMNMAAAG